MIDPRISLAGVVPSNAPALQLFNNALTSASNRSIAQEQAARQAELQPLLMQQNQQAVDQNQLAISQAREANRLSSIHETGQRIRPLLESGNVAGAQAFLIDNIARLQARKEAGENVDTTESAEALVKLQNGDVQGLIGDIDAVSGIISGIAGQKRFATKSSAPIIDPETGQVSIPVFDPNTNQASLVPVEGAVRETPSAKREADVLTANRIAERKAMLEGKSAAVKQAINKGGQAFDKIQPISTAIANYDEAIAALDGGANTGAIASLLPSFKKASIELDNVVKRLGLDVVGNTTFGALSESELAFALKAAIPDNLQPADLKQWLIAKRDAQKKVKERVEEAASFLSSGENTLSDWVEFDKAKQLNLQNKQTEQQINVPESLARPEATIAAPKAMQVGRFTVEEVQ